MGTHARPDDVRTVSAESQNASLDNIKDTPVSRQKLSQGNCPIRVGPKIFI